MVPPPRSDPATAGALDRPLQRPARARNVLVAVALTAAVVAAAVIIPAAAGWGRVTMQPNGAWSGCGNVHRATAVHISRVRHHGWKPLSVTRYRPSLARRLYFDFCVIVGHPAQVHGPLSCPAEYSLVYDGTFYAGSRTRATFDYEADGCQALELAAGGSTQATIIMGRAAVAEPGQLRHRSGRRARHPGLRRASAAHPSMPSAASAAAANFPVTIPKPHRRAGQCHRGLSRRCDLGLAAPMHGALLTARWAGSLCRTHAPKPR